MEDFMEIKQGYSYHIKNAFFTHRCQVHTHRCQVHTHRCQVQKNTKKLHIGARFKKIIYFDGVKWAYALENLYIPLNDEDKEKYYKQIEALNVTDECSFIDRKYKRMYPNIEKNNK